MKQSRLESFIEVCLNTAIGFGVSFSLWPFVSHLYGLPYSHSQAFGITAIFTITSILRSYVVRRWFNNGLHHAAITLAAKLKELI